MTQLIVLSVIGTDRAGIVQEISKVILDCGGNIEESRMTALGAEFAMLLLISGNWHTLTKLESGLDQLTEDGSLTINLTKTGQPTSRKDCMPYAVDVVCLDQPGVVFGLAGADNSIVCAVEFEPVPAITGKRPFTISTALPISSVCSDFSSVADSPVVPAMTSPSLPSLT